MVYLIWYFLFREASHNTRDSIFQVLDEGLIQQEAVRRCKCCRAAIMAAWQPYGVVVDGTGATGNNFTVFATQVMEAQSATVGNPSFVGTTRDKVGAGRATTRWSCTCR